MNDRNGDNIDRLIAYVENHLDETERIAFEAELADSEDLRRQLELMRRIDRSLAREFSTSEPSDLSFDVPSLPMPAPTKRTPVNWPRWAAIASAAVAASLLLAVLLHRGTGPVATPPLTVAALYQSQVSGGFVPDWVCEDDQEFIDTTRLAFGLPLLATTSGNVEIVGWAGYGDRLTDLGLSPSAKEILARVDGREVIVLIDKPPPPRPPAGKPSHLNIFERRIGDVALYEITPLDRPAAIERFELRE